MRAASPTCGIDPAARGVDVRRDASTGARALIDRVVEYPCRPAARSFTLIGVSFDPRLARDVVLPLAAAAAAVFDNPGAAPVLPDGYHFTALLEADEAVLAEIADAPAAFARAVIGPGPVFGLVGANPAAKTAFVAFRGTRTLSEWLDNFDAAADTYIPVAGFGEVHAGWMALYTTIRPSLVGTLVTACAGCDQLLVTGHSLGAALAVLAAPDLATNIPPRMEPRLITFAGPKTGLHSFVQAFNVAIESCFRVVNQFDIVPHLPLAFPFLPYEHVGVEIPVDSGGPVDPADRHNLDAYRHGLDNLIGP